MVGRTSRRCYVCEKEVELVGTMKDHMQKAHRGEFRLSNNLGNVCKTACKLCGKVLPLQRMRTHTKEKHGMGITEYKSKFNQVTPVTESFSNQIHFFQNFFDLVEKIFHECGLCSELVKSQQTIPGW